MHPQKDSSNYGLPKAKKGVRHFLGLASYYSRFVPNFLDVTSPITYLTKKRGPDMVQWMKPGKWAFAQVKSMFKKAEINPPELSQACSPCSHLRDHESVTVWLPFVCIDAHLQQNAHILYRLKGLISISMLIIHTFWWKMWNTQILEFNFSFSFTKWMFIFHSKSIYSSDYIPSLNALRVTKINEARAGWQNNQMRKQ